MFLMLVITAITILVFVMSIGCNMIIKRGGNEPPLGLSMVTITSGVISGILILLLICAYVLIKIVHIQM